MLSAACPSRLRCRHPLSDTFRRKRRTQRLPKRCWISSRNHQKPSLHIKKNAWCRATGLVSKFGIVGTDTEFESEANMNTPQRLRSLLQVTALTTFVVLICIPADAQWKKVPAAVVTRGPDGQPNLAAPTPRLTD